MYLCVYHSMIRRKRTQPKRMHLRLTLGGIDDLRAPVSEYRLW
jgi:hypothetical protein